MEILIWLFYEKRTQAVVRFWAQKSVPRHFNNFFFNLVLDLFYWAEAWRRSASVLVILEREENFDPVDLRKKVLRWLSDFELKKIILGNFAKTVFQSSLVLFLLNWGLVEACIPTSRVRKGKEFVIWMFYEKSAQVVVRFRARKILSRQFYGKCFSLSSWTYSTELSAGGGV